MMLEGLGAGTTQTIEPWMISCDGPGQAPTRTIFGDYVCASKGESWLTLLGRSQESYLLLLAGVALAAAVVMGIMGGHK